MSTGNLKIKRLNTVVTFIVFMGVNLVPSVREVYRLMVTEDMVRKTTVTTNGMEVTSKCKTFYIKELRDFFIKHYCVNRVVGDSMC
jgi:hypothetical protein